MTGLNNDKDRARNRIGQTRESEEEWGGRLRDVEMSVSVGACSMNENKLLQCDGLSLVVVAAVMSGGVDLNFLLPLSEPIEYISH